MNIEKIAKTTSAVSFLERYKRWGTANSLLPLMYGSSCCFSPISEHISFETGLLDDYSVEDSDLLIIGGSVTYKQLPMLLGIYNRMQKRKWVMAVGVCSLSGGPFQTYTVVQNLSEHIPIDIYVPGCPPTKSGIEDGISKLKDIVLDGGGQYALQ